MDSHQTAEVASATSRITDNPLAGSPAYSPRVSPMPLAFRAIVEVLAALRRSGKEHFSAASSSALHRSYWSSEVDWENFPGKDPT